MRAVTLAALCGVLLAGGLHAQETVSTASPIDAAPPRGADAQIPLGASAGADSDGEALEAGRGSCAAPPTVSGDADPRAAAGPHGEISAAIGSRGARAVRLSTCTPLGAGGGLSLDLETGRLPAVTGRPRR